MAAARRHDPAAGGCTASRILSDPDDRLQHRRQLAHDGARRHRQQEHRREECVRARASHGAVRRAHRRQRPGDARLRQSALPSIVPRGAADHDRGAGARHGTGRACGLPRHGGRAHHPRRRQRRQPPHGGAHHRADARGAGERADRCHSLIDGARSRRGLRGGGARRGHQHRHAAAQPPRPGVLREAPDRGDRRAIPRRRRTRPLFGEAAATRLARCPCRRLPHQPELGFDRQHVRTASARPGAEGTVLARVSIKMGALRCNAGGLFPPPLRGWAREGGSLGHGPCPKPPPPLTPPRKGEGNAPPVLQHCGLI